jgi:hypothetical protein
MILATGRHLGKNEKLTEGILPGKGCEAIQSFVFWNVQIPHKKIMLGNNIIYKYS